MSFKIPEEKISEFLKNQIGIKNWIEDVLSVKLSTNLHYDLKNGVVLCFLMKELDPSIIGSIEKPDHPLQCRQNITSFLKAASRYGVPSHRLFDVGDLWDGSLMVAVVECLLSVATIAHQKGFKVNFSPSEQEPKSSPEIISAIKKQLVEYKTTQTKKSAAHESIIRRKLSCLAGDPNKLNRLENSVVQLQAVWRMSQARKELELRNLSSMKRHRVVQELLDTETDYVRNLDLCVKIYLNPLKEGARKGKGLISSEDIHTIFSDIETILMCNQSFYSNLQERFSKWNHCTRIGKIFIDISHYFKVYANFVVNFSRSAQLLNKLTKKSSAFSNYLKDCHDKPEMKKLDLPSLLIMPVQRIPRYSLLLKDILKNTWRDHPDYDDLVVARDKVDEIATYLNEKKREAENIAAYLKLTDNFVWGKDSKRIVNGSRKLVRNGSFSNEKNSEVVIYLFNDVLIWGKTKRRDIVVKETLSLSDISVSPCINVKQQKNGIQLSKHDKVHARFFCKSQEEQNNWIESINNAMSENEKMGLPGDRDSQPTIAASDLLLMRMQQELSSNVERSEGYQEFQELLKKRDILLRFIEDFKDPNARKKTGETLLDPPTDLFEQIDELNSSFDRLSVDESLSPQTRNLISEAKIRIDVPKNKRLSKADVSQSTDSVQSILTDEMSSSSKGSDLKKPNKGTINSSSTLPKLRRKGTIKKKEIFN